MSHLVCLLVSQLVVFYSFAQGGGGRRSGRQEEPVAAAGGAAAHGVQRQVAPGLAPPLGRPPPPPPGPAPRDKRRFMTSSGIQFC